MSQRKKKERGSERILQQIIAENFPNLGNKTSIEGQQVQRTPVKINKNRSTTQHNTWRLKKPPTKEQYFN